MKVRSIKPEEIDACLDLLHRSFESTSRNYFKRYFYGDPWFKPEYTRMCEDDGKLVSSVQICRREVRYGCSTLLMGAIANVGTPPEYRGKGYSCATMKDSVDVMIVDGMDFSMLFTSINPFYERVGYVTVELRHGIARLKSKPARLDLPYEVRPYTDNDAEAVVDLFNEFNSDVILSVVRTPYYWRGFGINPERERYDVWIAESQGTIAAYLAGHAFGKAYGLAEMCCRRGHEEALRALAQTVWKRAKELKLDEIVYRLPDKESINTAIAEIAAPLQPRTYTYMMLRVLKLQSMFEKMLPELERRSVNVKGRGRVTIGTEFGDVTLDVAPGRVTLADQPSETRMELTQIQLFDLVFGYRKPHEVLPKAPGSDLLAALFPKRTPVYYTIDGF